MNTNVDQVADVFAAHRLPVEVKFVDRFSQILSQSLVSYVSGYESFGVLSGCVHELRSREFWKKESSAVDNRNLLAPCFLTSPEQVALVTGVASDVRDFVEPPRLE